MSHMAAEVNGRMTGTTSVLVMRSVAGRSVNSIRIMSSLSRATKSTTRSAEPVTTATKRTSGLSLNRAAASRPRPGRAWARTIMEDPPRSGPAPTCRSPAAAPLTQRRVTALRRGLAGTDPARHRAPRGTPVELERRDHAAVQLVDGVPEGCIGHDPKLTVDIRPVNDGILHRRRSEGWYQADGAPKGAAGRLMPGRGRVKDSPTSGRRKFSVGSRHRRNRRMSRRQRTAGAGSAGEPERGAAWMSRNAGRRGRPIRTADPG